MKTATIDQSSLELLAFDPGRSRILVQGRIDPWCRAKLACLADELVDTPGDGEWILVKRAGAQVQDVTAPYRYASGVLQPLLGGPNNLTRTLTGSALGGLTGYALGAVGDAVIPRVLRGVLPEDQEHRIQQSNLRGALGVLGAGAGALPGLAGAGVAVANGRPAFSDYPWSKAAEDLGIPDASLKRADDTGAMLVPSIPVDAFNKVIWSDALPQNPFGTKSSWGDNSPSLHTPPAAAAAVGGIVGAAGAVNNSEYVSPWDIAKVVANTGVNAGIGGLAGYATGAAVGRTLGILAGLSPETQSLLQRSGTWAGMIAGIARKVF